ncbi:MAG: Crp/Fnr family transcriptional regulator [Kiritimatiellia bacterium]
METYIRMRLKSSDFFGSLPEGELQRLARIAFARELRKGDVLFRQGEPCTAIYWQDTGRTQLVRIGADGTEVVLRTVRPGDIFAEGALFEQRRYPAIARAITPGRVVGIQRNELLALLSIPSFRDAFLALLMRRLHYLAALVEKRSSSTVESRLAHFLAEQYGRVPKVNVELSKKDVAAAIDVTPETLSRVLRKLIQRRCLVWQRKTVSITPRFWQEYFQL